MAEHLERLPQSDYHQAWVTDFDDTVAVTISERPIGGLDVNDAYELSLNELFGAEALKRYRDFGGHRNRTPAQIVTQAVPDITPLELPNAAERLKQEKLGLLIDQIGLHTADGVPWPQPSPGFLEFSDQIEHIRDRMSLTTGMISAGHVEFIEAFYAFHDVRLPEAIITDERVQALAPDLQPEERAKPNPYPMDLFKIFWHHKIRQLQSADSADEITYYGKVIYTGDDPTKDQQLALNSGVEFVRISPQGTPNNWPRVAQKFGIQIKTAQTGQHE